MDVRRRTGPESAIARLKFSGHPHHHPASARTYRYFDAEIGESRWAIEFEYLTAIEIPKDYFLGVPGPIKNQIIKPTSGNTATITTQIIFLVVSAELPNICIAA